MAIFPMKRIAVTASFGSYTISGVNKPHYGIDICAQSDRTVRACHAGRVLLSAYDSAGGNMIVIMGDFNGACAIITRYAHLALRSVAAGDTVAEGQKIGEQGETGSACLGRHLHLETWLVPSGYRYSYSDRARYAVDPIAVLHLTAEQSFVADEETFNFCGIPSPEPRPADLRELAAGSYVELVNKNAYLRYYPCTDYMPLTAGSDRRRYGVSDFCKTTCGTLPALYACTTTGADGVERSWAMLRSPDIGEWWIEVRDGVSTLHEIQPADEVSDSNSDGSTGGGCDDAAETESDKSPAEYLELLSSLCAEMSSVLLQAKAAAERQI